MSMDIKAIRPYLYQWEDQPDKKISKDKKATLHYRSNAPNDIHRVFLATIADCTFSLISTWKTIYNKLYNRQ